MNTTIATLPQVSGDNWKTDSGALRDGLDQLSTSLSTAFHTQHEADDTHGTITASGPISERGRTVPMGEWINVPFNAAAFSVGGTGNTWTVRAPTPGASFFAISYTLVGKTMWLNIDVPASTLNMTFATNGLSVNMPPSFRVAGNSAAASYIGRTTYGPWWGTNGGSETNGFMFASPGATVLTLVKHDGSNFVNDLTDAFTFRGQIFLEVEAV